MHPQPPWKGGSLREPQATPSRLDYCIFKPLDLFSSESGIGACASTPKDENNSTVRYRSLSTRTGKGQGEGVIPTLYFQGNVAPEKTQEMSKPS